MIAFLANDDRSGYRKFFHDKFFEYFLSTAVIDMLISEESGKVISRTTFGSSFLETFGEVISAGTLAARAKSFLTVAQQLVRDYPPIDSTRKNLGSLLVASLEVADLVDGLRLASIEMEECRFSGTAGKTELHSVLISQLDCRGGDLTAVSIDNSVVVTLIADSETRVPADMPHPSRIHDITLGGRTILRPEDVKEWIDGHLLNPPEQKSGLISDEMRNRDLIKLLFKSCRLRQYWMRRGDDMYAGRILDNPLWPTLESALLQNNLLTVELRQASGSDARFIHVRRPEDILAERAENSDVVGLFRMLKEHLSTDAG